MKRNIVSLSMHSFIDPYAISVYIIHHDKYLLIRRCGKYLPETWQMVTGAIHQGETAWEAAVREVKEETGLIPSRLYSADAVETFYMKILDKITCVPVFVAFVNEPEEVQLALDEHDAYEWLSYEQAKERLVWAEQKRVLGQIHENFILKEPSIHYLIDKDHEIDTSILSPSMALSQKPWEKEKISVRPMRDEDLVELIKNFCFPWSSVEATTEKWERYYEEHQKGMRTVYLLEKEDELIIGYASLLGLSEYSDFRNTGTPEVNDVWVAEEWRNMGLGKMLMLHIEDIARIEGFKQIGIGVGLYSDYGKAQRLYVHLGYIPDGKGITYKTIPVTPGKEYPVDDDLILWMTKSLD